MISFVFVVFFAWKSWTLLHEAWVDGQVSQSKLGAAALDPLCADGGRHELLLSPLQIAENPPQSRLGQPSPRRHHATCAAS